MLQMNDANRQIHIHNLSTDAFYHSDEKEIHDQRMEVINKVKQMEKNGETDSTIKEMRDYSESLKSQLKSLIASNKECRVLNDDYMTDQSVISLFDSVLTRTMGIYENELTTDLFVVEAYFEGILEDLIHDGFYYNGEHYIFFSASAGQTRNKRSLYIKESVYNELEGTLTCGLSKEEINQAGGINTNKYLSYLSLVSSSTNEWVDFPIDETVVVDDLEVDVTGEVDHVYPDYSIQRENRVNTIEKTDGAGMILPHISDKSFMLRAPWVKGLIVPFDFRQFAEEKADTYIITDIYGKQYDVRDISIILTKSQFKLHKYYQDWQDYQRRFKDNHCQAGILNVEDTTNDARFNYQFLQTLTDITDDELQDIAQETINDIKNIGKKDKMLKVMGANKKDTPYRKALSILPEMLNDMYCKETVKDIKKSMVEDAKSGKVDINGKFTFTVPDLYAMCQSLFGLEVTGLLASNEVYCDLYDEGKLSVLRSPHLNNSNTVRDNAKDGEKSKWFISEGVYVSIHDYLEYFLSMDWDGDKLLVTPDKTIIEASERNMEGVVPLYYEMFKAESQYITKDNIYTSLTKAYQANIGVISNTLSKIFSGSEPIDYDVVKWLCKYNNEVIDYAKTLYVPERPDWVKERINKFANNKLPYFFKFAKDKNDNQVEEINNSPVNRLGKMIPNKKISWKTEVGNLDHTLLMDKAKVTKDDDLIAKYQNLNQNKWYMMKDHSDSEGSKDNSPYVYSKIREELLQYGSESYVTDQLVSHLYSKNNSKKATLWYCFGDQILANLEYNVTNKAVKCEDCGSNMRQNTKMQVRCSSCQRKKRSKKRGKKTKK